ncbi:MAG: hypothetical protein ACPLQO_04860 [Desulfotomaculales bacterium]
MLRTSLRNCSSAHENVRICKQYRCQNRGRDLGSINREIAAGLAALNPPQGYYLRQDGQQEDITQTFRWLLAGVISSSALLAAGLIYPVGCVRAYPATVGLDCLPKIFNRHGNNFLLYRLIQCQLF